MFDKNLEDVFKMNLSGILLTTLAASFLVWYITFLWGRRYMYLYSFKVPGPIAVPFYGNCLIFRSFTQDAYSFLYDLCVKYPNIFRLWVGPQLVYVVSNPKYIEILSTKCLHKGMMYEAITKMIGPCILTNPNIASWKANRRIIAPTFNKNIIDTFIDIFNEKGVILTDILSKHCGQYDIDIFEIMSKYTIDLICKTGLGIDINAQVAPPEFVSFVEKNMEITAFRMWNPILLSDFLFSLTSMKKAWEDGKKVCNGFSRNVILNRITSYEEEKMNKKMYVEEGKKKMCFIDHLIQRFATENEAPDVERIKTEVNIFIVAGSDTTAILSAFCTLTMALFPDVQEKLYNEVVDVMGTERFPEAEDMSKLPFMERFIKETVRIFPPAPFIGRQTQEHVDIGDYIIPKDTVLLFPIKAVHMNEKFWPNPYKFDPDRFLPEEVAKRHPCAFLPFSYGTRNCVGERYGMVSIKVTLANLVRKFKFHTAYKRIEDIELTMYAILRAKHGFKLTVEART